MAHRVGVRMRIVRSQVQICVNGLLSHRNPMCHTQYWTYNNLTQRVANIIDDELQDRMTNDIQNRDGWSAVGRGVDH